MGSCLFEQATSLLADGSVAEKAVIRGGTLQQWHATYEGMQAAVAQVLDNLHEYREELAALMTERFHLVPEMAAEAVPVWGR